MLLNCKPFSSQVEPWNFPVQLQLKLSSSFSQVPPFLQGELSHGFTKRQINHILA